MSDFETTFGYEEETYTEDVNVSSKKKSGKKGKGKKKDSKFVVALVAIVVAFIIWICLVVVQDRIVNDTVTQPVIVAILEVPEGIELTRENITQYFTIEQRDVEQIPASVTTYSNGTSLVGLVTDRVIHAKEIATNECFYEESFYDEVENGVEISIDLAALGRSVAGTLKAGDFVNIRSIIQIDAKAFTDVDEELMEKYPDGLLDIEPVEGEEMEGANEQSSKNVVSFNKEGNAVEQTGLNLENFDLTFGVTGNYVVQNVADRVRVTKVFNSGGESAETVEANGGKMIATIIKVVVPREKASAIWLALTEGTLYVEKVLEPDYELQFEQEVNGEEQVAETAPQN